MWFSRTRWLSQSQAACGSHGAPAWLTNPLLDLQLGEGLQISVDDLVIRCL